jgi:hypothetical protein
MERILRGKYLVRKSKLENGTEVITLSGVFHPQNFNVNEIKDNDEMWVSDIIVSSGGIKFTDPIGSDGGSPEDFISGSNQSPSYWKTKESL